MLQVQAKLRLTGAQVWKPYALWARAGRQEERSEAARPAEAMRLEWALQRQGAMRLQQASRSEATGPWAAAAASCAR